MDLQPPFDPARTDIASGFTTVIGGSQNDMLTGADGQANRLEGRAGNDTLNGGNQGDMLLGGDDGDTLNGGGGNDSSTAATASTR